MGDYAVRNTNAEIQYIKCIGEGSFGKVWSAIWNNHRVAVKKLDEKYFRCDYDQEIKDRYIEELKRESQVLQNLIHPNILRMYTILFPRDESPVIITELLHCDLRSYIENSKSSPKVLPSTLKTVCLGVAEGLNYLHTLKSPVAHRDISTKNILLTKDEDPKIADLGVAKVLTTGRDEYATSNPGTPIYSAPETIGNDFYALKYGVKADIFSYGVVLMAMINGREPRAPPRTQSKGSKISEIDRRKKDVDAMRDHHLKPLVLDCLNDKATKRPTAKEIIKKLGKLHQKESQRSTDVTTKTVKEPAKNRIIASVTRNHFELISTQHDYDHKFKVLLIGNSGVGKTCLMQKLKYPTYDHTKSVATLGIDLCKQAFMYNNDTVELQITDTAGQEQFFSIQPLYFRDIDGMFLVYDVLTKGTFERLPYWLDFAKQYFSKCCVHVVLVGNKVDCKDRGRAARRAISTEQGQAFADKLGYPYIETSVTPEYSHTIIAMYEKMVEILVETAEHDDVKISIIDGDVKKDKQTVVVVDTSVEKSKCPCTRSYWT